MRERSPWPVAGYCLAGVGAVMFIALAFDGAPEKELVASVEIKDGQAVAVEISVPASGAVVELISEN